MRELAGQLLRCATSLLSRKAAATSRQGWNIKILTTAIHAVHAVTGRHVIEEVDPSRPRRDHERRGRLRAMIAQEHQRGAQALKLSTAVAARLEAGDDAASRDVAAEAQASRVHALMALGRWPEAIRCVNTLITAGAPAIKVFERMSQRSHDDGFDLTTASALMAKAIVIDEQKKFSETSAAYDEVIHRYATERSAVAQTLVWLARYFRRKAAAGA